MWDIPSHFSTPGQKEPDHVLEARSLAERLAIPHYTLDVRDEFRKTVVQSFIDEYLRARTPNPVSYTHLIVVFIGPKSIRFFSFRVGIYPATKAPITFSV